MKQQQQKQNTISIPRTLPSFASRGPGVSAVKKRIRDLNRFLARVCKTNVSKAPLILTPGIGSEKCKEARGCTT